LQSGNRIEVPNEINSTLKHIAVSPFFYNEPNILFQKLDFFPSDSMSLNDKLNTVARLILILTLAGFLFTHKLHILIIGVITLGAIVVFHHSQTGFKKGKKVEGFKIDERTADALEENRVRVPADVFDKPTAGNPFANVLIPDYEYNVNKKPAPPVSDENLKQAKQTVIDLNWTQPDIADKLFKNLGDEFEFEQSMQRFVSQPATTIPNDQAAFSQFLYGSMVSCKEGNLFACARNNGARYNNY
jgi:hypothetical protein